MNISTHTPTFPTCTASDRTQTIRQIPTSRSPNPFLGSKSSIRIALQKQSVASASLEFELEPFEGDALPQRARQCWRVSTTWQSHGIPPCSSCSSSAFAFGVSATIGWLVIARGGCQRCHRQWSHGNRFLRKRWHSSSNVGSGAYLASAGGFASVMNGGAWARPFNKNGPARCSRTWTPSIGGKPHGRARSSALKDSGSRPKRRKGIDESSRWRA